MKKIKLTLLTLLTSVSLISFTSCDQAISSTSSIDSSIDSSSFDDNSSEELEASYYLSVVSYPETSEYFLYQQFDATGLEVHAITSVNGTITSNEAIEDYTLTISKTGDTLSDGDVLTTTGSSLEILVEKDGYASTTFTIGVENVTQFTQSITIDSYPQTYYYPGETFSLDGISLSLSASFYTINSGKKTSSYELNDYEVTINGQSAEGYVLPSEPTRLEATITATSYTGSELTTNFAIFVISKTITGPSVYEDDTITFEEDNNSLTVHIDGENITAESTGAGDKGYYSPDEVKLASNFYDYSKDSYDNWKYAPASSSDGETQQTPLLVVPVVVPGYESSATQENLEIIENAFFGKSDDMSFESLHSYYYRSSLGKLDIIGTVTDYFYAADESSVFTSSTISEYRVGTLAEECAEWAAEVYGLNLQDYDSDSDGLIDGMWLVYVGPSSNSSTTYWAFSSRVSNSGDVDSPEVNNYGWCGLDFITSSSSSQYAGDDAHVLIHETGHMFGLNDYYSYSYSGYGPLGDADMMDYNVGDHNAYSKMMLGWTTPYIAYGDCDITLDSSLHNQLIVIPYDSKTYETDEDGKILFNPFDEYLVLEFYVPDGMNAYDYDYYGVETVKDYGLRVYHVDNRMIQRNGSTWSFYEDPDDALADDHGIRNTCTSNTETNSDYAYGYGESRFNGISNDANAYDEIRWITQDGTYLNASRRVASNVENILFKTNDSFSLEDYSSQFVDGALDCEEELTTTFTVTSINYSRS